MTPQEELQEAARAVVQEWGDTPGDFGSEYAAMDNAVTRLNRSLRACKAAWQPIETAPEEGWHFRGIWVSNIKTGKSWFETHWGFIHDETGEFVNDDGEDFGWSAEDYTHWFPCELPQPPETTP
jgi:hypothetical protein